MKMTHKSKDHIVNFCQYLLFLLNIRLLEIMLQNFLLSDLLINWI